MKIIFNSRISDWYWQIYDELSRNHELILPDNYKDKSDKNAILDLDALEKCVKENKDAELIFDFRAHFPYIVEWVEMRKMDFPLFSFAVNAIDRPYIAKMALFTKVWYVEKHAKLLMDKYKKENTIFLGMAANPYIYYSKNLEKVYDISFFGQHYGERAYWLNIVQEFCLKNKIKLYFPIGNGLITPWSFDDINIFYNQTKINLAFAPQSRLGRIVNLRTFEICMSGNFQLMQYSPCIKDFFEIDEEIVCWKNKNDLFEKILYYLENEKERERIAKKGYKRAIENHTWSKRLETISVFLKKTEKNLDLKKFIVKYNQITNKIENYKYEKINSNNSIKNPLENLKLLLRDLGYNLKAHLKMKTYIKIICDANVPYYYRPNLNDFRFIILYGKIMMVIKLIPHHNEINLNEWDNLNKILHLTENLDQSNPQYGVLTNGYEYLIRDFVYKKWLKSIPDKKTLKTRVEIIRYNYMRIKRIFEKHKLLKKYCQLIRIGKKSKFFQKTNNL